MTYYYVEGTTIGRRYRDRPKRHWIQDTEITGHYEEITDDNAKALGYYELQTPAAPDADHVRTIELVSDEVTYVWTFDQDLADSNAAAAADEQERTWAKNQISKLRTFKDQANGDITNAAMKTQLKLQARILIRLLRDTLGD